MDKLQNELIPKWKALGLVKEVIVTQSNLKDTVQIQQMRQLVDRGVDALIICCSNATAINETVKYAYDKGVPTFSIVGYVTSPYAVNSSTNFVVAGELQGEWLGEQLGKKGNVLIVEGIPGTSTSNSIDRGIKVGLAKYPDIKIVGDVAGMWTDQVAQAEVQKWVANHPGDLDGVAVQSAAELSMLRALEQSGRKMPPVAIGGEEGALCYWRHHPDYVTAALQSWPPADEMEISWNIMMRTMQGQAAKSVHSRPVCQVDARRSGEGNSRKLQRVVGQVVQRQSSAMGWQGVPGPILLAARRSGKIQTVSQNVRAAMPPAQPVTSEAEG